MSDFTISKTSGYAVECREGRRAGSKLWFEGVGIKVYVAGKAAELKGREPEIRNLALNKAYELHIPMLSFRDVRVKPKKARKMHQGQLRLL